MMKNKERAPSSVRTYDKDGFRRRAACVCVKDEFEDEVLLVSRPRQINQWIFPGGGIEPKEDPRHAAAREVVEEAGVIGSIVRCLGVFETEHTRTCVYVLQVSCELNEWDDSIKCGRKRMWFTLEDAKLALGAGHAQLAYLTRLKSPSNRSHIPNNQPLVIQSPRFCFTTITPSTSCSIQSNNSYSNHHFSASVRLHFVEGASGPTCSSSYDAPLSFNYSTPTNGNADSVICNTNVAGLNSSLGDGENQSISCNDVTQEKHNGCGCNLSQTDETHNIDVSSTGLRTFNTDHSRSDSSLSSQDSSSNKVEGSNNQKQHQQKGKGHIIVENNNNNFQGPNDENVSDTLSDMNR